MADGGQEEVVEGEVEEEEEERATAGRVMGDLVGGGELKRGNRKRRGSLNPEAVFKRRWTRGRRLAAPTLSLAFFASEWRKRN